MNAKVKKAGFQVIFFNDNILIFNFVGCYWDAGGHLVIIGLSRNFLGLTISDPKLIAMSSLVNLIIIAAYLSSVLTDSTFSISVQHILHRFFSH